MAYLRERELFAPAEERIGVLQQGLEFLLGYPNKFFRLLCPHFLVALSDYREYERDDLGRECVDEEVDARTKQGRGRRAVACR